MQLHIKILTLFLLLIDLLACNGEHSNPDYKSEIIGKWSVNYPGVPYYYGEAEYKENGEMVGWAKIIYPDGTIEKTLFHDSWEIKGDKIIFKPLKKYKHQEQNETIIDTIVDINDKEMILLNADGKTLIRTRIRDYK